MTWRSMLGWSVGVAVLLTLPAWAAEYRLQVVNLDDLTISSYSDRPVPGQPGEGSLFGSKRGSTPWSSRPLR